MPLDDTLRGTNRQLVQEQLGAIGGYWKSAISSVHTEARFKAMIEHTGASPVRDMLLNLALGWVGGALVGAAIQKVGAKYAVKAAMRDSAVSLAEMKETFAALGKKGGEKLAAKIPKPAAGDNVKALMDGFAQLATEWTVNAALAVRYLPDAA